MRGLGVFLKKKHQVGVEVSGGVNIQLFAKAVFDADTMAQTKRLESQVIEAAKKGVGMADIGANGKARIPSVNESKRGVLLKARKTTRFVLFLHPFGTFRGDLDYFCSPAGFPSW